METRTVKLDDYEIDAEVTFEKGTKGDQWTAPTHDAWVLTGRFFCNRKDVTFAIMSLDQALDGKLKDDFYDQING